MCCPVAEDDFQQLGIRTEGFSGSDCSVVVKDVLMQPIRQLQEATHFMKVRVGEGASVPACVWVQTGLRMQ